jgi:alkanesulfonate monooxygenase SsuD/methylene tetrahydromethanopterin reductase-like flavin-dependent oxidoreductase (luciferase family)
MTNLAAERIGIALWTMQSTAAAPAPPPALYRAFARDAALVEQLGFHSVWTAEHRAWYDGWCPALIHAEAFAAATTTRLRFGNSMLLLPQHDPVRLGRSVATLDRLTGGRVDLGAGLGHRDAEFDLVGLRRDRRGRLMEAALDALREVWAGAHGDEPPVQQPAPPVWIGGMAPRAIARAAERGHNLMLPQTLYPDELRQVAEDFRAHGGTGRVGIMRDVWPESDPGRAAEMTARIERHYREEAGSWWVLKGRPGFTQPELLDRQLGRIGRSALIGPAEDVAAGLQALLDAGAEPLVLLLNFDVVRPPELHEALRRLAADVVPRLALPAAAAESG